MARYLICWTHIGVSSNIDEAAIVSPKLTAISAATSTLIWKHNLTIDFEQPSIWMRQATFG